MQKIFLAGLLFMCIFASHAAGGFIDEINAERAKQGKPLVPVAETPYASDLALENAAKAFGYGVLDFGNSLFLGGLAQASKNLGRIPEWLNWTSGESISPEDRARLIRSGYSPAEIDKKYPYEKSWLSQVGDILAKQGAINKETIGNWETETLGNNPSTALKAIRGIGASLPFLLAVLAVAYVIRNCWKFTCRSIDKWRNIIRSRKRASKVTDENTDYVVVGQESYFIFKIPRKSS